MQVERASHIEAVWHAVPKPYWGKKGVYVAGWPAMGCQHLIRVMRVSILESSPAWEVTARAR